MRETWPRPTYAPKVPIGLIARLYQADALGLRDLDLADKMGWRLHSRCRDVVVDQRAGRLKMKAGRRRPDAVPLHVRYRDTRGC